MAFTTPRTWTVGEVVTKNMLDEQIRDNMNAIWVGTATGDIDYYATATSKGRLAKPTVSSIMQNTPTGIPSWRAIKQTLIIQIVDVSDDVDTSSIVYFPIPSTLNGYNLVRAQAQVKTAGTTGATTLQVRNLTKYPSNNALSTAISIASGDIVGTPGTINTSRDDVSTDDLIEAWVTGVSTTKPKGLWVVLEYQLP